MHLLPSPRRHVFSFPRKNERIWPCRPRRSSLPSVLRFLSCLLPRLLQLQSPRLCSALSAAPTSTPPAKQAAKRAPFLLQNLRFNKHASNLCATLVQCRPSRHQISHTAVTAQGAVQRLPRSISCWFLSSSWATP